MSNLNEPSLSPVSGSGFPQREESAAATLAGDFLFSRPDFADSQAGEIASVEPSVANAQSPSCVPSGTADSGAALAAEERDPPAAESLPDVTLTSGVRYLLSVLRPVMGHDSDALNVVTDYMTDLLRRCGAGRDPIREMVVQQIAITHHQVMQLQMFAGSARSPEIALGFTASAMKLLREFCELIKTLQLIRSVPLNTGFSVREGYEVEIVARLASAEESNTKLSSNELRTSHRGKRVGNGKVRPGKGTQPSSR